MAWQLSSVRTRVAQQLVLLFVACALAPLCAFASLVSWMVSNETRQHALQQLRGDAKDAAMATLDRMALAESRLRVAAELLMVSPAAHHDRAAQLAEGFDSAWFIGADGTQITIKGSGAPRNLSTSQARRLASGGALVVMVLMGEASGGPQVEMVIPVGRSTRDPARIVARADARVLWNLTDDSTRRLDLDVCVVDDQRVTLACSDGAPDHLRGATPRLDSASGMLAWRTDREGMLGAYWSAPLLQQWGVPYWTFVVAKPAAVAEATIVTFRRVFTVVVVLTLTAVVGVSLRQIRRRLEPLERLQDASASVRQGDYGARAVVSSGDEFQALAESFNLMAAEVQRQFHELKALNVGTLEALARTIDAKSPWTAGHSQRVAALGVRIAREMGVPPPTIEQLHYGGLLHDIGKLGVPSEILDKEGSLTPDEMRVVRLHPELGARILEPIAAYAPMLPVVLEHHERYDGSGYPRGLAGEAISLGGRIFAVADVVDALSSDRPYRAGLAFADVVQFIEGQAGRHFDPAVVKAFRRIAPDLQFELEQERAIRGTLEADLPGPPPTLVDAATERNVAAAN